MRKFLIPLLLASAAATPALAGPDGARWNANHPDQQETRAERQQARSERSGNGQAQSNNVQTEVHSSGGGQHDFGSNAQGGSSDSVRGWRGGQMNLGSSGDSSDVTPVQHPQSDQETPHRPTNWQKHERRIADGPAGVRRHESSDEGAEQQSATSGGRNIQWRRLPRTGSGDLVQSDRPLPRVLRTRIPVVSDTPREGTQPPPRTDLARRTTGVHWNSSWRHDNRYNWWDWRRRHHSYFHRGFYYDPFGWGYQPYSIGWRLWPIYYSSRYWITDPWQYRLPYAPPGYRWIRYYDDLLLVDTWDGQVIDVIHDFFW